MFTEQFGSPSSTATVEAAAVVKEVAPPVEAPPYVYRPPFTGLVQAAAHEGDFLVPLGLEERRYAFEPMDFALFFKEKMKAERMADALAQALIAFPLCAGRFVLQELETTQARTPLTIQASDPKPSVCILCNNAGAGWSFLDYTESMPPWMGPLSNNFIDFVSDDGLEPPADGRPGGPIFKARLSSFIDGQILGVSFAQGLADCKSIGLFLRTWSYMYRGEDPGPPALFDRLELDDLFRRIEPGRVKLDFALLNKSRTPMPRLAPEKSVVAFSWSAKEIQSMIKEIQDERKSRHISLDRAGKNLEALDIACAAVLHGFETTVPVHMWLDYRSEFVNALGGFLFGNARGQIAFDTPPAYEDAAEMMRRRVFAAHSQDFWGWQLMQGTKPDPTGVTIFPLLDDLALEDICFHPGDVPRIGLPLCLWEEQMKSPGYIAVLPEPSGGCHVEALVPRKVALQVSKKIGCEIFPIR